MRSSRECRACRLHAWWRMCPSECAGLLETRARPSERVTDQRNRSRSSSSQTSRALTYHNMKTGEEGRTRGVVRARVRAGSARSVYCSRYSPLVDQAQAIGWYETKPLARRGERWVSSARLIGSVAALRKDGALSALKLRPVTRHIARGRRFNDGESGVLSDQSRSR